ncbi:MAG: HD domain-containing phosphohydrolase [Thermodesulfobacteriota bacterium]
MNSKDNKKVIVPKKTLEELSILSRLPGIINSYLDIEMVMQQSMICMEEFMNAEASSIFEMDEESKELFFRFAEGKKGKRVKEIRLNAGEGISGWVVRSGEPAIVPDVTKDKRFSKKVDEATGFVTRSVLCVPLKIRGKIIGAIQVLNKKNAPSFTETDFSLLTSLSDQIAIALENARLYNKINDLNLSLKRKLREISLLLETSITISSSLDLTHILQSFAEKMSKRAVTTACRILFLDDTGKNLIVQAAAPIRNLIWDPDIGMVSPVDRSNIYKKIITTKRHILIYGDNLKKIARKDGEWRFLTGSLKNVQSVLLIPLIFQGKVLGIVSLGESRRWSRSPFDTGKIRLCKAIANQAATAIENARLFDEVKKKSEELEDTCFESMKVLSQSIEQKDEYTREHSERMVKYSLLLGDKLGLSEEEKKPLRYSAVLHDIGKINIKGAILGKPASLKISEYNEIKTHPEKGAELIKAIKFLQPVIPIILHHHEKWNGEGYPDGLKGGKIPIGARIICILDAYDAMTSDRPYKRARGREWAISELKRFSGKQFDPQVVKAFLEILAEESA